MDQSQLLNYFPDMQPFEFERLNSVMASMNERQANEFINIYRSRRRDKQTMLLLALLGFIGVAGVHRFLVGEILMGILYFFTAGFCFIGTIVDLLNIQGFTDDYNARQAAEAAQLARMIHP